MQALLTRHGIQHFSTEREQKAAVIERFNRTIKIRIWTYLSDRGTVRWVDIIQDLVSAYNNSRHRSIGVPPVDFQKKDENRLWVRLFGDGDTHFKPSVRNGAMVRASSHKTIFDNGNMPNWTKEHITVSQAVPSKRETKRRLYWLVDYHDESVKGSWYPEEIQEISNNQSRIEKVLRRRTLNDGTKELFVRWAGWPDNNN